MFSNYHLLIKFLLTIFTLLLSTYFFFIGYNLLEIYKLNKSNIINKRNNESFGIETNKKESFLSSKNDHIFKPDEEERLYELKKNDVILENEIIIIIKKNDTFGRIIDQFFANNEIKNQIINELNKDFNFKKLKIGQKIYFYKNNEKTINKIVIPIDFATDIIINISNNEVSLLKQTAKITKEIKSNKFLIKSSLYEDGRNANLPYIILSQAIRLFSFDVDFQRDIQKNNELEISYEILINNNKRNISYGKIKYIKLSLQQNTLEYFMFITDEGYIDYFNVEGKNVKKALMKTPIDGAKLSSTYGLRKHPILGYNKLHKGVDFAAPKGTPVYAAGNGVIEFAAENGSYGKYIRIRHNNSYKTSYAHLNNFKKGIYKGVRVNQEDIIGYVGSTGRSTGSHLHYEIIYQGKQINPMKIKLPSGKILKGNELKRFKKESKKIYSDFLFSLYE